MNLEEFKKVLKKECEKNNIDINKEERYEQFYKYMLGIIEWNEKINVTAITDEKEFIIKHFVDSLTIDKYIEKNGKVIDIGTGAGFPGIPLKISNPEIRITLIDSVNKKLNVIKDISNKIGISNLEIIHCRAEELANNKKYRERFDFATTRAVSKLYTITEYMLPFLKIGGKAICMKGPNFEEEIMEANKAIEILGGKIEKIEKIIINDEIERNIIILQKIKNTPNKYPRGQGKPLKEPI